MKGWASSFVASCAGCGFLTFLSLLAPKKLQMLLLPHVVQRWNEDGKAQQCASARRQKKRERELDKKERKENVAEKKEETMK